MTHEAPTISPEIPAVTQDEINQAFIGAMNSIYGLTNDRRFLEHCQERGIDPEVDIDKAPAAYWGALADTAQSIATQYKETGKDSLKLRAFELATAVPAFVFAGSQLDNRDRTHRELEPARQRVSAFKDMVRDFATSYSDVHASTLSRNLLNVVNRTVDGPTMRHNGANEVNRVIRKTQHELGFEQILEQTGRQYWQATPEQRLEGTDYIVASHDGNTSQHISVRPSLTAAEGSGSFANAYHTRHDGVVTMHSLIRDNELHDGFGISDEAIARKVETLDELLEQSASGTTLAYAN